MKKLLIILATVVILILSTVVSVYATNEASIGGSVTVGEIINIILTDTGEPGLNFGTLAPGTVDSGEQDQTDAIPALTITISPETNVDELNVWIKGDGATGPGLPVWKYMPNDYHSTGLPIPSVWDACALGAYPGSVIHVWHFVDIPNDTPPGTYNCTVWYKATESGTLP